MERTLLRTDKEIAEIYDRCFRSVWNISFTLLRCRAYADDNTADTFVRLIEKNPVFENETHEKAWLILTAKNLARDRLRHWWTRRTDLEEASEIGENDPEPDETLEAVLALPEKYRLVIYLYYYEGYTSREIAKMLGLSDAAVRSRLKRARDQLKNRMGGSVL